MQKIFCIFKVEVSLIVIVISPICSLNFLQFPPCEEDARIKSQEAGQEIFFKIPKNTDVLVHWFIDTA